MSELNETLILRARSSGSSIKSPAQALYTPWIDFFLLGGSTVLFLPIAFLASRELEMYIAGISLLIANFINHPHFAHSYQIFYGNLFERLQCSHQIGLGYILSGFVIPILLIGFLSLCFFLDFSSTIGLAGNLMAFLVGWHYVKQGYGVMIVQSVLKKAYFSALEKKVFLWNAYALWIFSWLLINSLLSRSHLWGIDYFVFKLGVLWVYGAAFVAILTTILTAFLVVRKAMNGTVRLPWLGVMAYTITLYIWLFAAFKPVLLFCIPALHSLQYLAVVWRLQWNKEQASPSLEGIGKKLFGGTSLKRFLRFLTIGFFMGYFMFWVAPEWLDETVVYNKENFGNSMFLFMFWIFINVHHYFIDAVIWRKDNENLQKFLLST